MHQTTLTTQLFRPVGLRELELIAELGFRGFPPRLDWQPIFYPVLNLAYAEQIARDWNTRDGASGYCGFVTVWEMDAAFLARYTVHTVGAQPHQELWIPADELPSFNAHIIGPIQVLRAYYGDQFNSPLSQATGLPASVRAGAHGRTGAYGGPSATYFPPTGAPMDLSAKDFTSAIRALSPHVMAQSQIVLTLCASLLADREAPLTETAAELIKGIHRYGLSLRSLVGGLEAADWHEGAPRSEETSADEAIRKAALADNAGVLLHELRVPVFGALGLVQALLENEPLPPPQRQTIARLRACQDNIAAALSALLGPFVRQR